MGFKAWAQLASGFAFLGFILAAVWGAVYRNHIPWGPSNPAVELTRSMEVAILHHLWAVPVVAVALFTASYVSNREFWRYA